MCVRFAGSWLLLFIPVKTKINVGKTIYIYLHNYNGSTTIQC